MKKKITIGIGALVLVIFLMSLFMKPESLQKKVNKLEEDLTSYKLEGNMEITN